MALVTFQAAYAALDEAVKAGESQADAVPPARELLKAALSSLLLDVASDPSSAAAVDRVLVTWRAPVGKCAATLLMAPLHATASPEVPRLHTARSANARTAAAAFCWQV